MANPKQSMPKLSRRALGEEVSETLRAAILSGQLGPGERLIEEELAEYMGVSRGPIREALRQLEADRLVVTSPRRGSFVAVFSRQDVDEIYSLRAVLEGVGARWLAERMTDEAAAQLGEALERMKSVVHSPIEVRDSDLEFHRLVAELSTHKRVYEAWRHIQPQIQLLFHAGTKLYRDPAEMVSWHERMFEALRARDADQAEGIIRAHIQDAAARLLASWPDDADTVPPHEQ